MKNCQTTIAAVVLALIIHLLVYVQLVCPPSVTYAVNQPAAYSVARISFNQQPTSIDSQPTQQVSKTAVITPAIDAQAIKKQPSNDTIRKTLKDKPTNSVENKTKQVTIKSAAVATPIERSATMQTAARSTEAQAKKVAKAVASHAYNTQALRVDPIERKTNQYINFVRSEILKRKHYPKQAKIRRHQGNITVAFTLTADGNIENIELLKKSPSKYLNKSVRKLLSRLRLPAAEVQIRPAFPKQITVTLEFSLETLSS